MEWYHLENASRTESKNSNDGVLGHANIEMFEKWGESNKGLGEGEAMVTGKKQVIKESGIQRKKMFQWGNNHWDKYFW